MKSIFNDISLQLTNKQSIDIHQSNKQSTMLYIGAHDGSSLAWYLHVFDKVYAFDADIENIKKLNEKFKNASNLIITHGALVSSDYKNKTVTFNICNESACSSLGVFNKDWLTSDAARDRYRMVKQDMVPAIHLDEFCKENKISYIDMYLSDIQGMDFTVLKTMDEYLKKCKINKIVMECSIDKRNIYDISDKNKDNNDKTSNHLKDIVNYLEPFSFKLSSYGLGTLIPGYVSEWRHVYPDSWEVDALFVKMN